MRFIQFLIEQDEPDTSSFPPLFHGTSSDQLVRTGKFNQQDVYLTVEEEDAVQYAYGKHLGGAGGQNKYVLTISARGGKIYDGDDDIQQIIMDQHEQYETFEQLTDAARKAGYRYVTMLHPPFGKDNEDTLTVISLYPNQDLQIVGVERV